MPRDLDPTKYKIERYDNKDRYFRWIKGCYKYGDFVNLFQNGSYSSHWQELDPKIHHRITAEIKSHPDVKVIDLRTPKPTENPSLKQKLLGILALCLALAFGLAIFFTLLTLIIFAVWL